MDFAVQTDNRVKVRCAMLVMNIEKCATLAIKSGKRHLTDRMELLNQDKIRTLAENETYKYLGLVEADTIKQVEMKNKFQKEYLK